jgi:predicted PurR-regulated permease PerM
VRGQLLLGASIFLATTIGLTILTVIGFSEFGQFTLVLALIAGVLEWFPIIGPIIAAIPAILIGLSIGFPAAIAAAVLYIAIQQLENNILVPKVMGDAVELHPAVMILALVVGGALFGIGGAILAAPTVAAGRDLYRYGFHRFGGQPPAEAFELAKHGARRPPVEEQPPPTAPPPEAEAALV